MRLRKSCLRPSYLTFGTYFERMTNKIGEAVAGIRRIWKEEPSVGIILGSGLGDLVHEVAIEAEINYGDIPGFPVSTVEGHGGKLIMGSLSGKKVVVMSGRFHYYEGYSIQDTVFPVRVMKFLGIKTLMLSNAAGGVNRSFKVGDLMLIKDHISQFMPNPLIGKNDAALGPRFPDMSEPYNKKYMEVMSRVAVDNGIELRKGVYVGVTGPTFETRAEYDMIRILGGDAVGMSTVPEAIVAAHMGIPCLGMSVISDLSLGEEDIPITHEEVLAAVKKAGPKLSLLFKQFIAAI